MSVLPLFLAAVLATNSFAASTQPQRPTVSVRDFGAVGNCQHVVDGTTRKGSTTLTSPTAQFTQQDIGKPIYVLGAGLQKIAGMGDVAGAPLSSRIVEVKDAHTINMADAVQQDISDVSVTWGTDDTHAIQKAIDSLAATGGTVFFPAGMYRVVYQGGPGLKVAASNIRLQGTGKDSAIFNSTVIFHAKVKDGVTYTEQMGVPVLYVGQAKVAIENVEVDHLWLGDNGEQYHYPIWGPHGPGVLGSAGKIDHFSFHDLTIATRFLCGINMNSQTTGFSIYNVNVLSSGDHGFYLAGTGSAGDIHDNRLIGTTGPMRQGIVIKKKNHIRLCQNEIANVEFQAIGVEGDDPSYISRDVLIADNWIHNLKAWHTDAITIFNAQDVVIRGNRITDTSWIGINLHTRMYTVSNVIVRDNVITRAGRDPSFAINVGYDPPPKLPAGAPWPGSVDDITIENNSIVDSPLGIALVRAGGHNTIRGNRVENHLVSESSVGYKVDPLTSAQTEFTQNIGVNCAHYIVSPNVVSRGNDLK